MHGHVYSFSIDTVGRKAVWAEYGAPLEIVHLDDARIHTSAKMRLAGWPEHDHISFNFNRLTLVVDASLSLTPTADEMAKCGWPSARWCEGHRVIASSIGNCELIARPEDMVSMTPAPMVAPNTSFLDKSVFSSNQAPLTEDDIQKRAKRTELGKGTDTPQPKPTPKATASLKRCDGVEALVGDERRCLKPKDSFKDCPDCPEMVVVPAGEFMMGSPEGEADREKDEGPQRNVVIAKPFAVGKFEVTFAEWDACVAAGGCKHKPADPLHWGRGERPVFDVSWDHIAKEFLPWLSRKTGRTYRLLTEAEWEYAARAGTTTPFSTGRTITTDQANFNGNVAYEGGAKGQWREKTVEVGSFKPNAFGLHDMHGNVWEWVEDCYDDSYAGAPVDGSAVTSGFCKARVSRGGSWSNVPGLLRSADRTWNPPGLAFFDAGFRVAGTF